MQQMKAPAMEVSTMRRALALAACLSLAVLTLTACGGGGGGGGGGSGGSSTSAPAPVPQPATVDAPANPPPASINAGDAELAARLYAGDERTPAGFDVEERPSNVLGTLSTRHLKNTDLAAGPQAMGSVYEMCTNDLAEALDWSERQATWHGQYSDLVEVRSDERLFELVRVPRADVSAMIRHRVFRCDYLDRSGTDLRADGGAAGSMNQRPLTAVELEKLAEYLWQFTMFNNADHAVVSSTTVQSGDALSQTIRMGQLERGVAGSCDTVHVMDWVHTMNTSNGALSRSLVPVRSYQVKNAASGVETCAA